MGTPIGRWRAARPGLSSRSGPTLSRIVLTGGTGFVGRALTAEAPGARRRGRRSHAPDRPAPKAPRCPRSAPRSLGSRAGWRVDRRPRRRPGGRPPRRRARRPALDARREGPNREEPRGLHARARRSRGPRSRAPFGLRLRVSDRLLRPAPTPGRPSTRRPRRAGVSRRCGEGLGPEARGVEAPRRPRGAGQGRRRLWARRWRAQENGAAVQAVRRGPSARATRVVSWVHLDDLVGLFLLALDDDHATGPLNAVSPRPATSRELATALGRVLHRPQRASDARGGRPAGAGRAPLGSSSRRGSGSSRRRRWASGTALLNPTSSRRSDPSCSPEVPPKAGRPSRRLHGLRSRRRRADQAEGFTD